VATFRVLVICTANHCRSPIGEQLLAHDARARFGGRDGWLIESAGTNIPGPWPLHPHAATVLGERLPTVAAHRSVQMSPAMIGRADLVLTATRQHRSAVVSALPAAIGRTFTILQFARLCEEVAPISASDTADLGRELVVQAKLARSSVQPVPGEQDDLPDPMGKGVQEFRLCADRLQGSIDRILRPLTLRDSAEFRRP
jgi:protein-tyrosine phosphatase